MSVGEQTASLPVQEEATHRWWSDRALLALLALFVVLAPLVTARIYASDEIEYFSYTHSLFFDRDLDFSNEYLHFYNSDPTKFQDVYNDLYLKREPLTNLPINVAPIGTGLLWLPSYALAHGFVLAARQLGANIPADGYSQPYITAIALTSYIFGCLGLLLSYLLCKKYFGRGVSALAVVTMWLATPLIFYTVIAPPWSHATSLFTVTLFLWYWDRTRAQENRSLKQWAALGALAGLAMLVREQDALFLAVPAVEVAAKLFLAWRERAAALRVVLLRWVAGLLVMAISAAIVFIPQLITYRVITGRFSPSKVVSSKFTLTAPNFLNVLFSPEHGLFAWTPVILVALVGLFFLWRRDWVLTLCLAVAFLLQVYIAGSFLTWESAGSFGQRRFINSTAIFALGFAALASWALARGVPRWAIGLFALLFVAWNGGLLMQYALWCSPQRQGLDWAIVLRGQLEMPGKALGLIWDYLTNRSRFYRETRQC